VNVELVTVGSEPARPVPMTLAVAPVPMILAVEQLSWQRLLAVKRRRLGARILSG
jgi:hypothetical protein